MKKIAPLLFYLLALGLTGCSTQKQEEQTKVETITIKVASVVCGSCAKTIEGALKKVDGLKDVKVDVDQKIVTVQFLPAKTNLNVMEKAIAKAGYDANHTKRNTEAYEKLDVCCKIDG